MVKPSNYCIDCNGPCRETRLHGIPGVRVTSPSRIFNGNVVGAPLTDAKIESYAKAGWYSGTIKLPEATGPRCLKCNGTHNVKRREYNYLPKDGYYCDLCIDNFRESRRKERELAARINKARKEDYV